MKKNRAELMKKFDKEKDELATELYEWLQLKDLTMYEAEELLKLTAFRLRATAAHYKLL